MADINYELQERKPYLQKSSIYVFRKAANVVAVNPDYIFRNCEIRLVDGNDLYVIFYAGSRGNVYVVTVSIVRYIHTQHNVSLYYRT